jgi:hypothetical protein
MNSTRRGFLSALSGVVAIPPWRVGWCELPPRVAHDTSPSAATATGNSVRQDFSAAGHGGSTSEATTRSAKTSAAAGSRTSVRDTTAIGNDYIDQPFLSANEAWLDAWLRLPRLPLMRDQLRPLGKERAVEWFIASLALERIRNGELLAFFYRGGSEPGAFRKVIPVFLFTVPSDLANPDYSREPVYLLAHCLSRKAARTFRLDRISL